MCVCICVHKLHTHTQAHTQWKQVLKSDAQSVWESYTEGCSLGTVIHLVTGTQVVDVVSERK